MLRVLPGNEVHISHEIANQAKNNRFARLNQQSCMLVEFPALSVPTAADTLLYQVQLQGVKPILVHPERNDQIQARPSLVAEFWNGGS